MAVYQFTNKTVGLNSAPTSDFRVPLNFNERPYKTVAADGAAVQVDRAHNRNVVTKGDIHDSAVLERNQFDPPQDGRSLKKNTSSSHMVFRIVFG